MRKLLDDSRIKDAPNFRARVLVVALGRERPPIFQQFIHRPRPIVDGQKPIDDAELLLQPITHHSAVSRWTGAKRAAISARPSSTASSAVMGGRGGSAETGAAWVTISAPQAA